MTSEQVYLVRESFETMRDRFEVVTRLFYGRLFDGTLAARRHGPAPSDRSSAAPTKRPSRSEGHATLRFLVRGPSLPKEAGTLAGRRQVAGRAWCQVRRSRWSAMRFCADCSAGTGHVAGR